MPVQTRITRKNALLELKNSRADVIIPLVDEEEGSPRLLSSKVFRWSLIYNGKKGIDGAWKNLVNINAATLDRIKVTDCRQKVNLVRPVTRQLSIGYKRLRN